MLGNSSADSLCDYSHALTIAVTLTWMCSENVYIPVNPRTSRPVGYAFVDFTTSEAADLARLQLSGKELLERKISLQMARKKTTMTVKATVAAREEDDDTIEDVDAIGTNNDMNDEAIYRDTLKDLETTKANIAPPMNWNAINNTKIRTSLGGMLGKGKTSREASQTSQGSRTPQEEG